MNFLLILHVTIKPNLYNNFFHALIIQYFIKRTLNTLITLIPRQTYPKR